MDSLGCLTQNGKTKNNNVAKKLLQANGNSDSLDGPDESSCKMITSNQAGRYLVASENLPAGQLILQEEPIVLGPTAASIPVCLSCHAPVCTLYRCFKCQWPMCSPDCANQDNHIEECHILAQDKKKIGVPVNSDFTPRYDLIVILRCLLLQDRDPAKWNKLMTLESHWERRKEDGEAHHMAAVRYFTKVCPTGHDEDTLHRIRGVIMTNCINTRCASGINLRGLYPNISLLNHSCHPNITLRSDQNCQLYISTTVPVLEDQTLAFSYVPPNEPYWKRQRDLHDIYYFDCACVRCTDRTELNTHFSSLKCNKCTKSFVDPMLNKKKIYRCSSCRFSIPQVKVMHTSIGLQNIYSREDLVDDVNSAMHILKEVHSKAHGKHYTWLAAASTILRSLVTVNSIDSFRLKKQLWLRVTDMYEVLEPGLTRRKGVSLLQLTAVSVPLAIQDYNLARISKEILKAELERCEGYLKEAFQILALEPPQSTEQKWLLMAEKEQRRLEEVREQFMDMEKGEELIDNDEDTLARYRDTNHHQRVREIESLTTNHVHELESSEEDSDDE